jgi:hypothetical protein
VKIEPALSRHEKHQNDNLPKECQEDGIWRKRVIPTVYRWAGIQPNAWIIPDEELIEAFQIMCDAYYNGVIELSITTNSIAFRLVRLHSHHTTCANFIFSGLTATQ